MYYITSKGIEHYNKITFSDNIQAQILKILNEAPMKKRQLISFLATYNDHDYTLATLHRMTKSGYIEER